MKKKLVTGGLCLMLLLLILRGLMTAPVPTIVAALIALLLITVFALMKVC